MSAGYGEERGDRSTRVPTLPRSRRRRRGRRPFGTVDHPIPLIIDSDPGLDDALAIGLAVARPEIDLLAVTTVGGNADVTHCTENALRLLHAYGADDVPVAEGCGRRAAGRRSCGRPRSTARAASATRRLEPAPATRRGRSAPSPDGRHARRATRSPSRSRRSGPLTNIALLLRLHPELAPKIAHLCLMGGSIGEGNTTASAEFNIYRRPRGRRRRLPVRRADHDDRPRRHPPGAARPGRRPGAARHRHAVGPRSPRSSPTSRSTATCEWSRSTTTAIHDAVAVAHLAVPDLVDGRAVPRRRWTRPTVPPAAGRSATACRTGSGATGGRPTRTSASSSTARRFATLLVDAFGSLP